MKIRSALVALLAMLVASSTALAQDTHGVAPLDPPEQVKVAYVPIMKFAALFVAEERGLFEKYGLDLDINRVASGTEAIAFLTEGQIDVGGIAIVTSLWNGWHQGLDIQVIAPGALEPLVNSPTKLMVGSQFVENGEITSVEDLRFRNVAVAGGPGSGGEYLAAKALELGGLTIRDVNLINMGNPDMPAAFENGSIHAGILGSPYGDQVEEAGFAKTLATDLTPGLMTVVFVGSDRFINERPEVAKRFVLALTEATRLMQGDDYLSQENVDAYLRYVNSTEEAIRAGEPVVYDPNMDIPLEGLADVERVHRENGRTEYDEALDMSNVADTSFVDFALETLGKY